jgi:glycosyltransferase involved in cell wall biosynthesis
MRTQLISVVIPVRNEVDLKKTIASIDKSRSNDFELEIVLIDDSSTNGCCDNLDYKSANLEIKVSKLKKNMGIPKARNIGASIAQGRILFMTDAHSRFCKNWDLFVFKHLNSNNILAATISASRSKRRGYGCKLLIPDMGTRWNTFKNVVTRPFPVHVAASAGTVITKSLFNKIEGYDNGMLMYGGAEPEFSVRAWLSGAEIISVPKLSVSHKFKSTENRRKMLIRLRHFIIHNNIRFGLLYLPENVIFMFLRYYSLMYSYKFQKGVKLILESDVWERKKYLQKNLKYDLKWFIQKFKLKDQTNNEIDWYPRLVR